MGSRTTQVGRWLAVPLVVGQLLLSGAAVPHCHGCVAAGGSAGTAGPPHRQPHRHWAWGGHSHAGGEHTHGPTRAADRDHRRSDAPPLPVDHDGDAVYPADAFLVVEVGPLDLTVPEASDVAWLPWQALSGTAAGAGRGWRAARPPGDPLPTHHDLLPHVLRV